MSQATTDAKSEPNCDISLMYPHSAYPDYTYPYSNTIIAKFHNAHNAIADVIVSSNIITIGSLQCRCLGLLYTHKDGKDFNCCFELKFVDSDDKFWIMARIDFRLRNESLASQIEQSIEHKFDVTKADIGFKLWKEDGTLFKESAGYYKEQCLTFVIRFAIFETSASPPQPTTFNFAHHLLNSKLISDVYITINDTKYSICHDWVSLRASLLLLDWTQSLITNAHLSTKSIHQFLKLLHCEPLDDLNDFSTMLEVKWLSVVCDSSLLHREKEYDASMTKAFANFNREEAMNVVIDAFSLAILYPPFAKEVYALLQQYGKCWTFTPQFFDTAVERISHFLIGQFLALTHATSYDQVQIGEIKLPDSRRFYNLDLAFVNLAWSTVPKLNNNDNADAKPIKHDRWSLRPKELYPYKPKPDFTIKTMDGGQYQSHSWFLYARWTYFKHMIDLGGVEATQRQMTMSEECTTSHLKQLLQYLYCVNCDFKHEDDATWVLQYGHYYGMMNMDREPTHGFEQLVESCVKIVFQRPTLDNCISKYLIALKVGNVVRESEYYEFIVANFQYLMMNEAHAVTLKKLGNEWIGKITSEHYARIRSKKTNV